MSSTYTEKNTFFCGVRTSIPYWKPSPNRSSTGFSQLAFPTTLLPKGRHMDFAQGDTTGSSKLDHGFGLCGRRIQMSGHSDLGIFNNFGAYSILTWVQADAASAACPAHPDSLDTISMTFAAVICDAA